MPRTFHVSTSTAAEVVGLGRLGGAAHELLARRPPAEQVPGRRDALAVATADLHLEPAVARRGGRPRRDQLGVGEVGHLPRRRPARPFVAAAGLLAGPGRGAEADAGVGHHRAAVHAQADRGGVVPREGDVSLHGPARRRRHGREATDRDDEHHRQQPRRSRTGASLDPRLRA